MKNGLVIYLGTDNQEHGFVMEMDFQGDLLAQLREQIGCELVELVRPIAFANTPYCMLVDESGALKDDKKVNVIASNLYGDYIFGNAFILRYGSLDGDFEPLTENDISKTLYELVGA